MESSFENDNIDLPDGGSDDSIDLHIGKFVDNITTTVENNKEEDDSLHGGGCTELDSPSRKGAPKRKGRLPRQTVQSTLAKKKKAKERVKKAREKAKGKDHSLSKYTLNLPSAR